MAERTALRFGTDGVRARANTDLTVEFAVAFGVAAARTLGSATLLVGDDGRRSGTSLAAAVAAGAASVGVDVTILGTLPTPAVAFLCARDGLAGVMVSASHNAFGDNGLKAFAPGGRKLTDEQQDQMQAEIDAAYSGIVDERPFGAAVGTVTWSGGSADAAYVDHVVAAAGGDGSLDGLKLVIDCANGAASTVGPMVMARLGADVTVINAQPDGININDQCGSTHLDALGDAVRSAGAAVGVALDGDADRCLAVDELGAPIDGDQIMALCARSMHRAGTLQPAALAVTVMSNLGLKRSCEAAGIEVVETAVGDRHVLEAMETGGLMLGGEQSGHMIFTDVASTGDGLVSAVRFLGYVAHSNALTSEIVAAEMTPMPQCLINVAVSGAASDAVTAVAAEVSAVEATLGDTGRVLLRASGTEPLVRVMVEAATKEAAQSAAETLANAVRTASGAGHRSS